MPWSNNNNGGGPWGNPGGGNRGGPWGSGPQPSGPQQPDLEDLIRRGQDKLRGMFPNGGRGNLAIAAVVAIILVAIWLTNAIYTVQPDELGQELVFGKPKPQVEEPGLHFHLWPFETVEIVTIRQRRETIGTSSARNNDPNSLMLSGDQNIVDVVFTVIWRVSSPKDFLFNVADPEGFVRRVAESAMREYVGRSRAEEVRTERRAEVEDQVRALLQGTLDNYGAGITIVGVQLERADPPSEVADAFEEVQRAQQDLDRYQREAEQYANKRLGEARGEASKTREAGRAFKESTIAEAQGEAQRFISVFNEYRLAPEVTRKRIYLETLEGVLRDSNKVIMETDGNGSGVVPYLPLNDLPASNARRSSSSNSSSSRTSQQGSNQ
ncbi:MULTISPECIES: FtsH protease activity modulator HflK [Afifella]|uniref:FtsH protease activity modulator HflK n=1 Tax=Afifella TaxID=643217 RepID=UPI000FE316F6|nr:MULTISPECIES: FtsH protease activity modulator HflK [Afifella]MCT8267451.1 FtsH protease activity modulator HflK [Afifella sp. JA880]